MNRVSNKFNINDIVILDNNTDKKYLIKGITIAMMFSDDREQVRYKLNNIENNTIFPDEEQVFENRMSFLQI